MPPRGTTLPRWQSHKIVRGDRIREILPLTPGAEMSGPEDIGLRWYLDCGDIIPVMRSVVARGAPQVGDYYVCYEDGYESWSPAKAFEEGYTRL